MKGNGPAEKAWTLLFELFEAERHVFLAKMADLDVSPMDVGIVKELGAAGSLAMGDLFACRFNDKSSVTRFVDRLVKKGWVDRREHPDDRRVKVLSLTPEGEEARTHLLSELSEPPPSLAALDRVDQERLADILERAVASARARKDVEKKQARG